MNNHDQSWRTVRNPQRPSGKTALIITAGVFAVIALLVLIQGHNEYTEGAQHEQAK